MRERTADLTRVVLSSVLVRKWFRHYTVRPPDGTEEDVITLICPALSIHSDFVTLNVNISFKNPASFRFFLKNGAISSKQ